MADFNGVKNGNTYLDCKDSTARSSISTIEGLIPSGASTSNKLATASDLANKVNTSAVGANNGVASLDSTGKVPSSQLPSYVDDVLEYADRTSFPSTGETGKIYIAKDTNKTYRWSGSTYVEISEGLALGETSSTAYAGNKGKANADAITAIKDGSSIDSFGDVETALAGKMPNYGIGIGLYVDSDTNQLRADAVTKAIKDSPRLITSGAVFSGLSPKYSTAEQEETDLDVQDKFPFYDYSASAKRHVTFGNIKAKLKEYFDSLYTNLVSSATSGNFAGLDANGNLIDSGSKASDFLTTADIAGKQNKNLSQAIVVDGVSQGTVEGALGAINTLAGSNKTNITTINGLIPSTASATNKLATASVSYIGTPSSLNYQVKTININGNSYDFDRTKYMEQTVTLSTTGTTTVTFSHPEIASASVIEVFAGRSTGDVSGAKNQFPYTSVCTTSSTCEIVFPKESSAITIKVRIYIN